VHYDKKIIRKVSLYQKKSVKMSHGTCISENEDASIQGRRQWRRRWWLQW